MPKSLISGFDDSRSDRVGHFDRMDQESSDEISVRASAVGPDGQEYAILSYSSAGDRGPAIVLVPERAPGWLRSVFGLRIAVSVRFNPRLGAT